METLIFEEPSQGENRIPDKIENSNTYEPLYFFLSGDDDYSFDFSLEPAVKGTL